jgi:short-subunit dehydrogenase
MKNEVAWVIGASTGLGRQVAELLAANGASVIISSRNTRDLEALQQHLHIKFQCEIFTFTLDLLEIQDADQANQCFQRLLESCPPPVNFYFISGVTDPFDEHLNAVNTLAKIMQINFFGPAYIINEIIKHNYENNNLRILLASTVAAVRPRSKNISYSTAKRALENFCMGLLHSVASTGIRIQIVRLGYMDTNQSYGHKLLFKPADPRKIAEKIIIRINKGSGIYYLPGFWSIMSLIIKLIPFTIYKRLKF